MENRILLVDDEKSVLAALSRALFDEPLEIVTATSAEAALQIMDNELFKVVISDEHMLGMQGSEFLEQVKQLYPETVRIEAPMSAVNRGEIYRFFAKPWNDTEIRFAIRSAIEKYDLEEENRCLLATIRQQKLELKILEYRYPGISRVERDSRVAFVLPDISEDEIHGMVLECDGELKG